MYKRIHCVTHIDNRLKWHTIKLHIKRNHHISIEEYIYNTYKHSGKYQCNLCAFFGMHATINQSRRQHKAHTPYKVTKIPDKSGRCPLEDQLQHDFYKNNRTATYRSQIKARKQCRQFGNVKFIEARHKRHRKTEHHQHTGQCP